MTLAKAFSTSELPPSSLREGRVSFELSSELGSSDVGMGGARAKLSQANGPRRSLQAVQRTSLENEAYELFRVGAPCSAAGVVCARARGGRTAEHATHSRTGDLACCLLPMHAHIPAFAAWAHQPAAHLECPELRTHVTLAGQLPVRAHAHGGAADQAGGQEGGHVPGL